MLFVFKSLDFYWYIKWCYLDPVTMSPFGKAATVHTVVAGICIVSITSPFFHNLTEWSSLLLRKNEESVCEEEHKLIF